MKQLVEQFKPIKNYEGLYEISNYGRVKSLARKTNNQYCKKDIILRRGEDGDGYYHNILSKNGKAVSIKTCHLVFDHFGQGKRNGRILQIDHINNDKTNDRIDNLQLLSARENNVKKCLLLKSSSPFIGVCWHKKCKSWVSQIVAKGELYCLGYFKNEIDAANEYQRALKEFNEKGSITINTPLMKRKSSKYKGVYWCKQTNKWKSRITINRKRKFLGYFENEYNAYLAYKKAKEV